MTRNEVTAILARCASYDRRTVGQADVTAWLLVLGDLTHAECDAAVIDYYKENREWIMPSDIRGRVLHERSQWLMLHPGVGPLNPEIVPPWQAARELEA